MIQRLQSLFMFLVVILIGVMPFLKLSTLNTAEGEQYLLFLNGIKLPETNELVFNSVPLIALFLVVAIMQLLNIFLYKYRRVQMRICMYSIIVLVASYGLLVFYMYLFKDELEITNHVFSYPLAFPLVSIILLVMAYRQIRKDEYLVKSLDRIR